MADNGKVRCKYGADCYQRNSAHLSKYSHPTSDDESDERRSKRGATSPSFNDRSKKRRSSRSPSRASYNLRANRSNTNNSSDSKDSPSTKTVPKQKAMIIPKTKANSLSDGPSQEKDLDFINDCFDKETRFSQRAEYKELLKEPQKFIKYKFMVEMPPDFYIFWEFCKANAKKDQKPENIFVKFGLKLVGPFDVLAGKFDDAQMYEPGDYIRHHRYYYDPPEFQTILCKDKSGVHYGYWRDVPKENESCLVARNDVDKGCEIAFVADNLFSAVINFLDKDAALTPFNRAAAALIKTALSDFAKLNDVKLDTFSIKQKARNMKVVTKTFHKAGLVVPVDKDTDVGYRSLIETDANLKKILSLLDDNPDKNDVNLVMEKLAGLITAANIAVDECDFGNSIELGIDLFCYGAPELHSTLLRLLVNGYNMIDRPQFTAIIKAHLESRERGTYLSIL
ncbi:Histone PARylation factor 1-like [Pseudolycoriella hygida]|uniref:Histone PARylation factor 1-like n=1 Tax=Pseudolycoriella hygida TaxID=35572 RepID=A0A9Q0NE03_9DIPT|nr:Histone PARylation factor 1-like [Pseudolycoriella hygida]